MLQRAALLLWIRLQRPMWSSHRRQVCACASARVRVCVCMLIVESSLNLLLVRVGAGAAKVSQVKSTSNGPKALIIEPSKELAEQTLNNVKQFKKYVENPKLRHDCALTVPGRLRLPFFSTRWKQSFILTLHLFVLLQGAAGHWWCSCQGPTGCSGTRGLWKIQFKGFFWRKSVSPFYIDLHCFSALFFLSFIFCCPFSTYLPCNCALWSHHQIDIVVGTPGRLDDLISTGKLTLSQVRFLVLDECVRAIWVGKTISPTGHRLIVCVFVFTQFPTALDDSFSEHVLSSSLRMASYLPVIQTLSTGSTTKSLRSPLTERGCR